MYEAHWGLRDKPFQTRLDPRAYVPCPAHEEALARLDWLVAGRRRLGLLLGQSGSGKSLLLELAAVHERAAGHDVAVVNLAGLSPHEFLAALAGGWRLNPERSATFVELWRMIGDHLAANRWRRVPIAALLDDADEADPAVLEQVSRLCRCEPANEACLTIVLAARPEQVQRFGDRLLDLVELRIDVWPWDQADVERFIERSLARQGRASPAFTPEAIERLHLLAEGSVRRLVLLADLSLLAAAGQQLKLVDAHTVESVYEELGAADRSYLPSSRP